MVSTFASAYRNLPAPYQACLELAWSSLISRGLPVGSVITVDGSIVGQGRNRVYDPPGGADALQSNPLAHAELNAIASTSDLDCGQAVLWTTHIPCSMCAAAIQFIGIGQVRALASDPSAADPGATLYVADDVDPTWMVAANTMFLHNVAAVGGPSHPMLAGLTEHEPEIVGLATSLAASGEVFMAGRTQASAADALASLWQRLTSARRARDERIRTTRDIDTP
jgi:tRNA(Arg) A34 adenosine deaminase TadA